MDCPSLEDFTQLARKKASISAQIRINELNLQLLESEISIKYPRNAAMRFIGDEPNRERMRDLRMGITSLRNELTSLEAETEILQFHKDLFKAKVYMGRY